MLSKQINLYNTMRIICLIIVLLGLLPLKGMGQEEQVIKLSEEHRETISRLAESTVNEFHKVVKDVIVPQVTKDLFMDMAKKAESFFDDPDMRIIHVTNKFNKIVTRQSPFNYLSRLYRFSHGPQKKYERITIVHYNTHLVGDIYLDPNDSSRYVGTVVSTQDFTGVLNRDNRLRYQDRVQRTYYFNVYFFESAISGRNELIVKLGDIYARDL